MRAARSVLRGLVFVLPILSLAGAPLRGLAEPAKDAPLVLHLDASEAARKILHATLRIPAKPGPLTLLYAKWVPGEHGPTGPITDLAGLKIQAGGKPLTWLRDEEDMYALRCRVPEGVDAVEVSLDFLSPPTTSGFSSGASMTSQLAALNWNHVLLYPQGLPVRRIRCQASLRLPPGWKLGTALPIAGQQGDLTRFETVTLDTLVDSPVLCGAHFREVPLGSVGGAPHFLCLACDSEAGLALSPAIKGNFERLPVEGQQLFGCRHYRSYRFLLTLSDYVAHFGLEHHQCSDDRVAERLLLDDRLRKGETAQLLPHEFVHSWNGKYRRPADMITDDFQRPQRTRLLWVYEGLTQYLGIVLTARCGLWTEERFRQHLAEIGDWAQNQNGRDWRPLADTTVAAQLLFAARADWASWRRSVDFYDEGVLLWLDVDTRLREGTKGKRSLDDFCRRFHGGPGDMVSVKGFTLDDLAADLNAVMPYDWKSFLTKRIEESSPAAPLEGLTRSGWKVAYTAKPSELQQQRETDDKAVDLTASLGVLLGEDGVVRDVIRGKAAWRAGVGPGMKLIAVNGRRWSTEGLRTAVAGTKDGKAKLELLLENGDFFRTCAVDYADGERYPVLERITGQPDLLGAILRPLSPPAKQAASGGK